MSELFPKLGIDWRLLIAQLVNFLILLFVLRRFAYKPLLKLLDERKQKIADGLANAQKAKSNLEEAEKERQEIISTAKKGASEIINLAETAAQKNREETLKEAKAGVEKIVTEARKQIDSEKSKMIGEIKSEISELVMLAAEKTASIKLDDKKDKELIEKIIKESALQN